MHKKIGVLMGGNSSERDISLASGQAVYEALCRKGYDCVAIDIIAEPAACRHQLRASEIDRAFIVLHGPFGEDGTIQTILAEEGIAYTGSGPAASRQAMDKLASRACFAAGGITIPRALTMRVDSAINDYKHALDDLTSDKSGFVVKPPSEGSSMGISVVADRDGLEEAIRYAASYDDIVLIEACIIGPEVTVGVLNDKALTVIGIETNEVFFDFTAKYDKGKTQYHVPAVLETSIANKAQECALAAHTLLGCRDFSRCDMIIRSDGEPVVLEVNTIPGFTDTSLLPMAAMHAGISFDDLCAGIIERAVC